MIRIITDSLSDLTLERGKELNIDIMCLNVRFGEEDYVCGKEMTNEQFYQKLETSPHSPASSAVNPAAFSEVFSRYLKAGDDIVCVMFSSQMSATCQNAVIAASEFDSPHIRIIDCENASMGQGLLVETAVKLRDRGLDADQIEKEIRALLPRVNTYIVVESMEYLKRGGRISGSKALVGSLLRVHPVLKILADGAAPIDKVKGRKSCNAWLINRLLDEPADPDYPIVIGHSNARERAEQFEEELKNAGVSGEFITNCIGPIVGTHIGPNCLGIGYVKA